MTKPATLLLTLAAAMFAAAAIWWWLTYSDVISYHYIGVREASVCMVGDSEICRLARSLCRGAHPVAILAYSAVTFWLAVGCLSASLILTGRTGRTQS